MAKLTLSEVGYIPTAGITININSALLEEAFENTLSRDGSSPNEMNANLDINGNRILNLPAAVASTEPLRKAEFDAVVETLSTSVADAAASALAAELAETNAGAAEVAAEALAADAADSAADAAAYAASINPAVFVLKADGAAGVTFTPTGTIAATNVQAAIAEVSADVTALDIIAGPGSATDNAVTRWDGTTGNAVQNSTVTIDDSGNITGAPALIRTGGVAIQGRNTNGVSASGYVGETVSATVLSAAAPTLTSNTATQIATVSLTAGTWLVYGVLQAAVGTTATRIVGGISSTSAVIAQTDSKGVSTLNVAFAAGDINSLSIAPFVVNLASTTSYYLNGLIVFAGGTNKAYGHIEAIRIA